MDVGAIIYDRLTDHAGVAAIVGTRVSPVEASDKETLPLLIYQVTLSEVGEGTAPLLPCRVEVHCWAADDQTAQQLAEAVVEALDSYATTQAGTRLLGLYLSSSQEDRSYEYNEWGRLLSFGGLAARL